MGVSSANEDDAQYGDDNITDGRWSGGSERKNWANSTAWVYTMDFRKITGCISVTNLSISC